MKNRFLIAVLFALFFISFSQGQMAAGVSQDRLERYDDFLNQEVKSDNIAGAISYVMRRGEVVHQKTYGYSDIAAKTPIKQDQIMHMMSMTKPIISVAFMMLYEEGHFFLNDPVSKYLPEFKNMKVAKDLSEGINGTTSPSNKEISILHLLTHTAGFSHGLGPTKLDQEYRNTLYFKPYASIDERVSAMSKLPLVGNPGEQWYYSASPDVLSVLIEKFSGMSTAEFLEKRIFAPLGMKDTGYNIKKNAQDRWMPVYNKDASGKLMQSPNQLPVEGNVIYSGTHGLFSTAKDYMTFCQMLLNKGKWKGKQFLGRKTIELMTLNHVGDLFTGDGQGYGLGVGVTIDVADGKALGSEGHYYWGGAYSTYFFIDPKEEMIAILLTQLQPYSRFYEHRFRQYVYQAIVD
ncbi:serine hydrolase domain-containing protein [Spongiimicrobium salis]|uniref:serine hydrolase domain-containing protein n=1 Tax=Spongiimicrobium salis TaxID=1667022 RepID=UPI00374DF2CB